MSERNAPGDAPVVVGAALVRAGRVLAARRSAPPEHAGGWEFPGGKVEPGESEEAALVRECREELGVTVRPVRPLPGAWPLARGYVLRVWLADLVDGEPRALQDHSALRWLAADEMDDVAWLPQDREVARLVADHLAAVAEPATPAETTMPMETTMPAEPETPRPAGPGPRAPGAAAAPPARAHGGPAGEVPAGR